MYVCLMFTLLITCFLQGLALLSNILLQALGKHWASIEQELKVKTDSLLLLLLVTNLLHLDL